MRRFLSDSKGQSLIQVMVVAALLGILALGGMQLISGLNKGNRVFNKRVDANQLGLTMTNMLTSPEACATVFSKMMKSGENKVTVSSTEQKVNASQLGALILGNTTINKLDKYGDLTITDYYLENLKISDSLAHTAFGDLVIKTTFQADAKNTMDKEVRVPAIKFVTESDTNLLLECSSTGVTGDDVCKYLGGILDSATNKCENVSLSSATINGDLISNVKMTNSNLDSTNSITFKYSGDESSGEVTNVILDNGYSLKYKCVNTPAQLNNNSFVQHLASDGAKGLKGSSAASPVKSIASCDSEEILVSGNCIFKNCSGAQLEGQEYDYTASTLTCSGYENSALDGADCTLRAIVHCMKMGASETICTFYQGPPLGTK